MKQPLIHIGYHKTASTWLQRNIFENPETGFKRFISKEEIQEHIISPSALDFDATQAQAHYQSLISDREACSVISSERLSGNPHSGGYDSKTIADRLKAVFPDAKVLVVVREQIDAIASCYLQYVKFGGPASLQDYLTPIKRGSQMIPGFSFDHFDYIKLINYYIDLFGRENILILRYEEFKAKPQDFCGKISDFSQTQALTSLPYDTVKNQSISHLSAKLARQLNKYCARNSFNPQAWELNDWRKTYRSLLINLDSMLPQDLIKEQEKQNKKYIRQLAGDRYSKGNEKLDQIIRSQNYQLNHA